jgi:hypothetical protein
MPPDKAPPRTLGTQTRVDGLPVIKRRADSKRCERDIWLTRVVLDVHAKVLGAGSSKALLCQLADRLTTQQAAAIRAGIPPRRPLANPSVTSLDLCRGMSAGDLARMPGGANLKVAAYNYPTSCQATNSAYYLGVHVEFRLLSAAAPEQAIRASTVSGHRLFQFYTTTADSWMCDVTSVQKPTSNYRTVETLDFLLSTDRRSPRGQQLCTVLTREAGYCSTGSVFAEPPQVHPSAARAHWVAATFSPALRLAVTYRAA